MRFPTLSKAAITRTQGIIVVVILIIAVGAGAWFLAVPPAPVPPTTTATIVPPTTTAATTPATVTMHPELKVAFVAPGSILDHGWVQEGYEGLLKAEEEFGITTAYTEQVLVTGTVADYDRVIRDYARLGYGLVIGHDVLAKDAVMSAAADYPDVWFAYDGVESRKNVVGYLTWGHEPSYLAGITAAKLTKTKIVGAYNGIPIDLEVCDYVGFKAGVASVDPSIKVLSAWLGVWHDPKKGHDVVVSMADAGADIVYGIGDGINIGGIQGAKEKGIKFIGGTGNQIPVDPDTVIASVTWGLTSAVYFVIKAYVEGTIEGRSYDFTLHTRIDGEHIGPDYIMGDQIPADVRALVEEKRKDIMDGTLLVPFVTVLPPEG